MAASQVVPGLSRIGAINRGRSWHPCDLGV